MSHPYLFAKGVYIFCICFYSDSSQLLPCYVLLVRGKSGMSKLQHPLPGLHRQ